MRARHPRRIRGNQKQKSRLSLPLSRSHFLCKQQQMLLQLLRLLLLQPGAQHEGGTRCAHFVSIASNCCGNFCGSYRTYGSRATPLCLCLAKKTNTHCTHTAHTHTHTLHTQHALRLSKILAFQRFFTCLCRLRKNNFQCLLISFRPSDATSCLFRCPPQARQPAAPQLHRE